MYIHDIDFFQSDCGIRMKSSRERGGVIENIRVENLNMMDVQFPFSWIMDWHNEYNRKNSNDLERMPESWQAVAEEIPESKQMTKVRNIHVKNVQASLSPGYPLPSRAFDLVAFPEKPIEDVCFTHCTITAKEFGRIEADQNLCFESCILSIETGNTVANNTFDNR